MTIIESEAFLALDEAKQQELVDLFATTQYEVAARLGIEPNVDGGPAWTDEEADRIMADIARWFLPGLLIGSAPASA